MDNITPIVENRTCTQCGVCVGLCPADAINFKQHEKEGLYPIVDDNKCTKCQICVKACPGEEVDFPAMQQEVFGKQPEHELYGNFINIYTSYAYDEEIRYNGASGGVVTKMLNYMLEKKQIDGALVVRMSRERPLEPDVFIARSREELISAQQSKYLPVPMMAGLKEIRKDKNGKYAIVGLPCHFHALRKAEKIFPKLKKQIVLRIGLMCGFNPTLSSTKFLLRRAGVKKIGDVKEIKYRDGDWPCGFRAYLKDGSDRFLYPIRHFLFSHYVFERHRCAMCTDHMCEMSDMSIGDEWRKELKSDAAGWSYIITRTSIGQDVINTLVNQKVIYTEEINKEVIFGGQGGTMIFKKRGTKAFANIKKLTGKKVPKYLEDSNYKPKFKYYIGAFLIYSISSIFSNDFISRMFLWMPTKVFTKYRHLLMKLFED